MITSSQERRKSLEGEHQHAIDLYSSGANMYTVRSRTTRISTRSGSSAIRTLAA